MEFVFDNVQLLHFAIVSALRTVGYDGVLSIEHEDELASPIEGLVNAIEALRESFLIEPAEGTVWAN